ncbi:transporter substrate-binding domain-containing protein [bacterium]|nr:transporter substrate-binding domain-containing protein [bacterium]
MRTLKKLFLALAALLAAGCSSVNYNQITTVVQLNNPIYKVGGSQQTEAYRLAKKRFTYAEMVPFASVEQLYPALQTKKIDAAVFDRPTLDYAAALYKDYFVVLPEDLADGHVAIASSLNNKALMKEVNAFIKKYKEDGTYKEMYRRWIEKPHSAMPKIGEAKEPRATLKFATETENTPMNFLNEKGELTGFNIELIKRLALYLNVKAEIVVMDYSDLYEAAGVGSVDLAVASMDVLDSMKGSVLFSDEYIDCPVAVMVRKEK